MTTPSDIRYASDINHWDLETDVLVVGLGCAGAAAALEAAAAGVDVVALERASGPGGTSAMSGGVLYLGGGTPLQRACGFDDSPDEMFKYLMASCGERPDEGKIGLYCEQSVGHYDWFVRHGVPFKAVFYPHYSGEPPTDDGLVFSGSENAHPYKRIATPAPRGHVPQTPNQTGWLLMQKLAAAVDRTDATVLADTRCQTLVLAPDGTVTGAVTRHEGKEFLIRARRGVILTTGGFINNNAMLDAYAPMLRRCQFRVGAEGDDGSGIRMGIAAGGAAVHMWMGSISLPIVPPKRLLRGILINRQGQRFINEDAYFGVLGEHCLFRQDGKAYLVLDTKTFERPDVEREIAGVGETVEELEQALKLPAGSLTATLELYNRHAQSGQDPVFGKASEYIVPLEPPFGAFDCTTENSLYAAFTLGGLRTTVDGAVLTADDQVVPGLYAAGRASACIAAPGYSSGLSLGDATFFGRRAGRHAASQ